MKAAMGYLSPLEQLWMQLINTWFYTYGVGRVQTRIITARTKYFTFFNYMNNCLLAYTLGSDLVRLKCSNMDDYSSY